MGVAQSPSWIIIMINVLKNAHKFQFDFILSTNLQVGA